MRFRQARTDFKTQVKHHGEKSWKVSSCQAPQPGEWRLIPEQRLRAASSRLLWDDLGCGGSSWSHKIVVVALLAFVPVWLSSLLATRCLTINVSVPLLTLHPLLCDLTPSYSFHHLMTPQPQSPAQTCSTSALRQSISTRSTTPTKANLPSKTISSLSFISQWMGGSLPIGCPSQKTGNLSQLLLLILCIQLITKTCCFYLWRLLQVTFLLSIPGRGQHSHHHHLQPGPPQQLLTEHFIHSPHSNQGSF